MKVEQREQSGIDTVLDSAISNMEALMKIKKHNKRSTPLMLAINLLREGLIDTFADFEHALMRRKSRIHFIAAPLNYYPEDCDVAYPFGDNSQKPVYALRITLEGDLKAQKILREIGINTRQNLERLKTTGVARIPASQVRANNN